MTVPSYPTPGYPAPGSRTRPTIVTVASYLLYGVAAIQLINALLTFSTAGPMRDALTDVYAGTEAEGAEGVAVGVAIVGGVINLLLGAGFVALAFFNSKGKNASRIVTWVIGGISLCCLGAGLGSNALLSSLEDTGTGPSQAEVDRRLDEALPSWYNATSTTLAVIGLLAILVAIILLALPASNDFFRKPAPAGFDPSVPYPPYPGQQYPGYGQPGDSYPGQGQPGQPAPGLPPYSGPSSSPDQGQPGQSAPGLPPYPGQSAPGQSAPGQSPSGGSDSSGAGGSGLPPWGQPNPPGRGDDAPKPPNDPA